MGEYVAGRQLSISGVLCIKRMVNGACFSLASAIEAEWPRRGTRLGAQHESAAPPQAAGAQTSIEKLQQSYGQSRCSKSMSNEDAATIFIEAQLKIFEIRFGGQGGRIEFLQSFGNTLGLRAGKAALFELLDDAVGVDDEGGVGHMLYAE